MHSIYWLLDPNTLEIRYVGQTKQNLDKRLRQHVTVSKRPKYHVHYWIRSLEKTPLIKTAYTHLTQEEANTLESREVARLLRAGSKLCNLTSGGNVTQMSADTRRRMSESHSGAKNHFFGRRHSVESRAKIGAANSTQEWTDERRRHHAKMCSGELNGFFGKEHTADFKKFIAATNAGTYDFISPNGDKVTISNLSNFCRENKHLTYHLMWCVAHGRRKRHKGWTRVVPFSLDPKT